jgi:hypothetical protein
MTFKVPLFRADKLAFEEHQTSGTIYLGHISYLSVLATYFQSLDTSNQHG